MLNHFCFANETMKAKKYRMISLKRKNKILIIEYPSFFHIFNNRKFLKSAPTAEGGGCAIKFCAEITVNRATWTNC